MTAALPSIGPTFESIQPRPPTPFLLGTGLGPDPTAVMGRRIGAYVLDGLLSFLFTLLVVLAVGGLAEHRGATSCAPFAGSVCVLWGDSTYTVEPVTNTAVVLVPLAYALVFSVIVQGLTGATPGKALFRVRVVNDQGLGPGIGRAAARTVFLLIDRIPFCVPLVGLVTSFSSTGHRRVGDMAATTFVVDRQDTGRPIVLPPKAPATTGPNHTVAPMPTTFGPGATPSTQPESAPQPQWDPARDTYVLWDEARGCWLAFDRVAGLWREI